MPEETVTLSSVLEARAAVASVARRTPVLSSRTFSQMSGARVYLKAENLQRTGSFKVRGAANKLRRLEQQEPHLAHKGVVAASAGNHAQGLALAARDLGVPCVVVMPRHASLAKVQATRDYGARVVLEGESYDAAQEAAARLAQEQGLTMVHAFDDPDIIAGQGTIGLELVEEPDEFDALLVPVGGGGLIAGIALAVKEQRPQVRVIGVQAQAAPAAARSFHRGLRQRVDVSPTAADGIAVAQPGELCLPLMLRYVDDVVTVEEEQITMAMVALLERSKLLVEGAGAVTLAALLWGNLSLGGRRVVVLLSGGNVDLSLVSRTIDHGLAHAGRFVAVRVVMLDRPGELSKVLRVLAEQQVNVLDVTHHRRGIHLPPGEVEVELVVETRDMEHTGLMALGLEKAGYVPRSGERVFPPGSAFSYVAGELAQGR